MRIRTLLFLRVLTLFVLMSGLAQAQSWDSLKKRADSLYEAGNYQTALDAMQRALKQAEREFGTKHINYANALLGVGRTQEDLSQYTEAETAIKQATALITDLTGRQSSEQADAAQALGVLYRSQSRFAEAETLLTQSLQIREKIDGKDSENYAKSLSSLGALYLMSRNVTKAEPVLLASLQLQQRLGDKRQPRYATALNNLAVLYMYIDDYVRAEPFMAEVVTIRKQTLGEQHPTYAINLNNLAELYNGLGDYTRAIRRYREVLTLLKKSSTTSSLYHVTLNNLAEVYRQTGQYEESDTLFQQALQVIEQRSGRDHADYGNCLGNLALLYDDMNKPSASQPLYKEALSIIRRKMGAETPLYTSVLNNMAMANNQLGNHRRADSLLAEALAITVRIQGKSNTRYVNYLANQSTSYQIQGRPDRAIATMDECVGILNKELLSGFLYLPARQRQTLLNRWKSIYGSLFSITSQHPNVPFMADRAYAGSLFLKNLLLNEQTNVSDAITKTDKPQARALFDSLTRAKKNLSAQYTKPVAQRRGVDSLEARAEDLEKQLARQSAIFRKTQQDLRVRWEDVRQALKPGEAAVEFVSFAYHNGHRRTDNTLYMALVLRTNDAHPHLMPLCNETQLDRLLGKKTTSGQAFVATLYRSFDSEIDSDQLSKADSLYALVWQPIDSLLRNVRRVYVSPSGRLHQLAFAGLPYGGAGQKSGSTKAGQYLSDRYDLRLVGSTRSVASTVTETPYRSLASARLYGGIYYEVDSTELRKKADKPLITQQNDPLRGLTRGNTWEFLAGSQHEVEQIGQLLGKRATLLTGRQATEEDLKALSGHAPTVLHVATHGFFFPDAKQTGDNVFRASADPLLRAGILMAGANHVWRGGHPLPGLEDGILTAYEVANLNLAGTQLVVLSACETGLGEVQGSEGVFGLQRAFKMAGVNYVLMSLWQVADQPTSVFMKTFYRNWKKHQTIRDAFAQTQQQMRRRYPPAVWAAFVLTE